MDHSRISPGDVLFRRYKIEKLLGEGGMGQVWEATDTKLNRLVAIKIIRRALVDHAGYVARFEREMKAVARLKHPNIVQIYHTDITPDGRAYMIMERIPGYPLRVLIETSRRIDLVSAVFIAIQIAEALGAAHAVGIWHRDIKPENVMVSDDGRAWVLDFGIAKESSAPEERAVVHSGERKGTGRLGTVGYLPPEQAMNQTADHRGDFYQLGVVLYEMLAGRKPYDDVQSETDMLYAHAFAEPRPLMEIVPDCPEWVWPIVTRLLEKDPDARYDDVNELIGDLRAGLRESVPPGHPMARKIDQDRHEQARKKAFAKRGPLSSVPEGATPPTPPSSPDQGKAGGTEPMLGGWASTGPMADKPVVREPAAVNVTMPLAPDFVPVGPHSPLRPMVVEVTAPLPPSFRPPPAPSSPLPWPSTPSKPSPPSSPLRTGPASLAVPRAPTFGPVAIGPTNEPIPVAPPLGPPPGATAAPVKAPPVVMASPAAPPPVPAAPPPVAQVAPRQSSRRRRYWAVALGIPFGFVVVFGIRGRSGKPPVGEERAPVIASASAPAPGPAPLPPLSAAPVPVATAEVSVAVEPQLPVAPPVTVAAVTAAPAVAPAAAPTPVKATPPPPRKSAYVPLEGAWIPPAKERPPGNKPPARDPDDPFIRKKDR